jgi:hypothetical protein
VYPVSPFVSRLGDPIPRTSLQLRDTTTRYGYELTNKLLDPSTMDSELERRELWYDGSEVVVDTE